MGNEGLQFDLGGAASPAPVPLAHLAAFALGRLKVEPALCRVSRGGRCAQLEPLVMQALVALASAEGATLSRDDLIAACWDGRIVSDDAINRVISRLRKTLAGVGEDAVEVETIPRVGYRLAVRAGAGAPASTASAQEPRPGRRWRGAALAAATAAGAGLLWAAAPFGQSADAAATIRIQPVSGATRDTEEGRFVDELTGDFARAAEAIGGLNLLDGQAAAAAARSDFVVLISVDRERGNLAAQARLVGRDGSVLWSRTFADARGSLPALREQVAVAAAGVLRCGLERTATAVRGDAATARLFFAACDAAQNGDWATASSFARQVVARRPDLSAGWACLAMTTLGAGWREDSREKREQTQQAARRYAEKAIALDPHSGRAYIALAQVQSDRGAFAGQLATLERGLKADPELTDLHTAYSTALFNAGYVAASVAPALRALALNPTSRWVSTAAVRRLLATSRIDEAFAVLAREEKIWPDHPDVVAQRIWLNGMFGDPGQALALIDRRARETGYPPELLPFTRETIAWRAVPASLDRARLRRAAEAMFAKEPASAWFTATAMLRVGDNDAATAWMLRAPTTDAAYQWSALFWPDAAALRRDPRFFAAIARIGLVDLWRARGQWPDFCSEPGLRYDCRTAAARARPNAA